MPSEAKPFASLSSGLLARKGAARPAMRPQGFGQVGQTLEDLGWNDMGFEPPKPAERDLDHDAFGEDVVEHPRVHPTGLTPVQSPALSPVHDQQAEIADRLAVEEDEEVLDEASSFEGEPVDEAPVEAPVAAAPVAVAPVVVAPVVVASPSRRSPTIRSVPGSKGKAAFTLRLDPDRHLKLRLACAVDGRSAQQLVTVALDRLLEQMPELDAMAGKAKPKG